MREIIKYFVDHKIPVNILIIFFVVFGIAGTLALKSSFFPLIKPKYISINFALPGGSPNEIEEGVVLKIEDNLEGIAGIERVTSTSRENSGSILIETNTDYEIDAIILEVKNAVDKVSSFPIGLEPVIVSKMRGYNVPISIVIVEVIKNILFKRSPVSFENMKYFVLTR